MSNGVLLLVRFIVGATVVAAFTWFGWKVGGKGWALIALVFSCPVLGVAIARPTVELFHEGFGWLAAQPLSPWEGRYYEFDGVQVRIYEVDDRLWYAAVDVMKASKLPGLADPLLASHPRVTRRLKRGMVGLSSDGAEKLLLERHAPEAGRFILWMRREVEGPWLKKRGG